MDEAEVVAFLKRALEAITVNEQLDEFFAPEAIFSLPKNPYRIDDLDTFVLTNASFFAVGGRFTHLDARGSRVQTLAPNVASVSFYFAQRLEIGGESIGTNGKGTAIVRGHDKAMKVALLHLTENDILPGVLPTQEGISGPGILHPAERSMSRAHLRGLLWGCE